jgi:hypothetical protein
MPTTRRSTLRQAQGGQRASTVHRALTALIAATVALSATAIAAAGVATASSAKHGKSNHGKHTKPKPKPKKHTKTTKPTSSGHPITLTGGDVWLTFTASAWAQLTHSTTGNFSSSASTTPVAPATSTGSLFAFPITSGSLNSATGAGTVKASGGITISTTGNDILFSSSSSGAVNNPVVTLGTVSNLMMTSENFTPPTVTLLNLNTSGVKPAVTPTGISLTGILATLVSAGQQFFSLAGTFKIGEELGTITINATS